MAARLSSSGIAVFGSAVHALDNWTHAAGLRWTIQDNVPQFQAIAAPIGNRSAVLTPTTGLIGVPVIEADGLLKCRAKILPDIRIGNVVVIESETISGQFIIDIAEFNGDTRGGAWDVSITGRRF